MSKKYLAHLISEEKITIMTTEGAPIYVQRSNVLADKVLRALSEHRFDDAINAADKASNIISVSKGKFQVIDDIIWIDGEELPESLSNRLIEHVDLGLNTDTLENFWDNLRQNPSKESIKDLYTFLEQNNVPLTPDGHFIAYKGIRDNWKDVHSGKFDNSPGAIVEMPRDQVDSDRNRICSAGLHVAAWHYASTFSGQRTVAVKVNPRDVVSVPVDYQNAKMRTCRYEVLHELENEYRDLPVYDDSETWDDYEDYDDEYEDETIEDETVEDAILVESVKLKANDEGSLRVPGRFIRKLGYGHGFNVRVIVDLYSIMYLTAENSEVENNNFDDEYFLPIEQDNSVVLSNFSSAYEDVTLEVYSYDGEYYLTVE